MVGWLSGRSSSRERRDSELLEQIKEAHDSTRKTYGSRRVYRVLKRSGVKVGKARVERLMRETGSEVFINEGLGLLRIVYRRGWCLKTFSTNALKSPNQTRRGLEI